MIALPFNFQPESVVVTAGSYTIPAGKYAYVTGYAENGGIVTVDGAQVLVTQLETSGSIISVAETIDDSPGFTVTSGYRFEGQYRGGFGTGDLRIEGLKIADSAVGDTIFGIKAGSGDNIDTNSITVSGFLTGYMVRDHRPETNGTVSFWVPSGTVLSGSGTRKITMSIFSELT